ncbi:MAG: hypothetical protein ABJC13_10820 [Acidobacteriota bacterium]
MRKSEIHRSSKQVLKGFGSVVKALYGLAPAVVVVGALLAVGVVAVAAQAGPLMVAVILVIVLMVAVLVYGTTQNYGEAALALAAGLLSVYSVDWTIPRFIGFVGVWFTFSAVALLISSVRIATEVESIYVQGAIALGDPSDAESIKQAERVLRAVGKRNQRGDLNPVERAQILRLFAFRRIPVEVMDAGLSAVATLSIATHTEPLIAAKFITDVTRAIEDVQAEDLAASLALLVGTIRDCGAAPEEFFRAFESSRHLLLARILPIAELLSQVKIALEAGVHCEAVGSYLRDGLRGRA